jgi:hypothetical protein
MKISLKASALAASIALLGAMSAPAHAVLISGNIGIAGQATPVPGSQVSDWAGLTTGTWTGITFINPGAIQATTPILSANGFSASLFAPIQATFNPVSFGTPGVLFTATGSGSQTLTYTWSTVSFAKNGTTFQANFGGTLTLTGTGPTTYDPTPYTAGFSCSNNCSTGTWSINMASAVPVPGSLALLGVGLIGAAGVARRSVRAAA